MQELDRVLDRDDVTRCAFALMWSIIAASVVDLPEPVAPVTRTRPRGRSQIRSQIVRGSPSSSKSAISYGITRSTRRHRAALDRTTLVAEAAEALDAERAVELEVALELRDLVRGQDASR